MTTEPAVGSTVYFASPNLVVVEAVVDKIGPMLTDYDTGWVKKRRVYVVAKGDQSPRGVLLDEIDPDPAVPARVVQAKVRAKKALAEKRLARWIKALKKAEAHLPPEERTP